MAYYFFIGPYDKEETWKKLEKIGFQKKKFKPSFPTSYVLNGKSFIINFTDNKKGYMQIQGDGPEDIYYNKEKSKYFSQLEKLADILSPKYVVNDGKERVFPQLNRKSQ